MMVILLSLAITGILLLATLGIYQFIALVFDRMSAISAATIVDTSGSPTVYQVINKRLERTKLGAYIGIELERAGSRRTIVDVVAAAIGLTIVFTATIWVLLAPTLAVLGLGAAVMTIRLFLQRQQQRRLTKIIAQMPETARVLANASQAGLSLATAIEFTASEISEPSRSEMQKIADRLTFGVSAEDALEEFQQRIGSREVGLLISTLIVSARSGGHLVSALHDISMSLEQRKEIRRQMNTILSESKTTANFLVLVGIVALLVINLMYPGTVQKMTTNIIGIVALLVSGGLFAFGWVLIQRMARIDAE
ncbi:tight adherence protein B [Arcanobacterium wilhelmae]|uniref:Tight adherence protein B n=1 Tax=Arcanobacterium wilhelmae TaxID=1803177 RepID=A0ABT9NCF1_9ACTO|nr:type II secretion system F family protein [Arcanobacterium wilhelmae]MDP9800886.1 tight adherence protein B [Arcanobacterium wilhelmae]WFN90253.1 type II secretion system F family protein [Arcanobacterium wilhelmae]